MLIPLPYTGDKAAFLQALRTGHPGAAIAFYDEHAGHVLRTLRSLLGADEDVPDLLQEVFIRGLRGIGRLRDGERMKRWLGTIAVFVATQRLRQLERRARLRAFSPEHTRPTDCQQPCPDARRALHEVYEVLDQIPIKERTAFALRHIEGVTLVEVAAVCQTSLATLKRRLKAAERRFLAEARRRPAIAEWLRAGTMPSRRSQVATAGP